MTSFSHISAVAVLARQSALALVKCELLRQGVRHVPMQDISSRADAILALRPELVAQARKRAADLFPDQITRKRALISLEKKHNSEAI
jgi:hypothetical protein